MINAMNDDNTIIVWGPSYLDQPIELWVWNISEKESGIKTVRLEENINC